MKLHATYFSTTKLYTVKNPEFHLSVRSTEEDFFMSRNVFGWICQLFFLTKSIYFKKSKISLDCSLSRCICHIRELNRKIFPILTASQISEDFYEDFLEDDLGFAILAYYSDMLVGVFFFKILSFNIDFHCRASNCQLRYERKFQFLKNIFIQGSS
jgi:hypothetical protein